MILEQIHTGGDRNFGYLVADEASHAALVVDPSGAPQLFLDSLRRLQIQLEWILCTHSHYDHVGGIEELKAATGARVAMHSASPLPVDRTFEDGEELRLGEIHVRVIHTPGHSDDSVCYLVDDCLLTGDTLYVGKIGGTSSPEDARKQYDSLHRKLMTLPEQTKVYPGHDLGVQPVSTIGIEKRTNPFILQENFEQFVYLKAHWAEYKLRHGIL